MMIGEKFQTREEIGLQERELIMKSAYSCENSAIQLFYFLCFKDTRLDSVSDGESEYIKF